MAVKKIKKNTAAFYLTDEVTEALEEKAKKTGISKSEIVEQYLAKAMIEKNGEDKPMIITIMSFKGGVGKTTSAASIGICLAENNNRVLIIDLDGQGSISQYLGVYDQTAEEDCIADIMFTNAKGQRKTILDIVRPTEYSNVDIVPSNFRFSDADSRMRNESSQSSIDSRLRFAIEDALEETHYDYIVIDCPPSLGLVVTNAITALEAGNDASMIIIPVRCDGFAIAGLSNTISTIEQVARERRTPMRRWKLLSTIAEKNTVAYREGKKLIDKSFKNAEFFNTVIPKNTSVIESTLAMQPAVVYEPKSKAAEEYRRLAEEIEEING